MFNWLRNIFNKKQKTANARIKKAGFAISEAVKRNAESVTKKNHVRAGDFCNSCDLPVDECPVHKL